MLRSILLPGLQPLSSSSGGESAVALTASLPSGVRRGSMPL